MAKMMITLTDENGLTTSREMTTAEISDLEEAQKQGQQLKAQEAQIGANKAAAQAKLEALGLTTDDLKALGL